VPADENAVSVLVPKSDQTSEGGKSYIASDFCCALYIDPSFSHLSYDFEI
jgi:hypothetical protein